MNLPNSIEKERSLLGSIIEYNTLPKIMDKLRPEDFYHSKNREIYKYAVEMEKDSVPVDIVNMSERFKDHISVMQSLGNPPNNKGSPWQVGPRLPTLRLLRSYFVSLCRAARFQKGRKVPGLLAPTCQDTKGGSECAYLDARCGSLSDGQGQF